MRRLSTILTTAFALLAASQAQAVHLRGRIVSVGFPGSVTRGSEQGADHCRIGSWTPVRVDLTNDDGDLFDGWIEIRQSDRDGDPVVSRLEVGVRSARQYYLYVPAAADIGRNPFSVRVFSRDGLLAPLFTDRNEKLTELQLEGGVNPVSPDTRVILDISERPVNNLLGVLRTENLSHKLLVARASVRELPDLVAGLDMVDAIVWDAADPTVLDPAQRDALLEWTHRGGMLVIGVSRNWELLSKSRFGPLLPARLRGVASLSEPEALPEDARDLLFGSSTASPTMSAPLRYCPLTRESLLSDASSVVPIDARPQDRLLVARRPCGRGMVVLAAAEIHDLLAIASQDDHRVAFLRQLLAVRRNPAQRPDRGMRFAGELNLFSLVENMTAFQVTASLYFLFAFVFVVAYIVVATIGSWTWLKRKALLHYAWPAFALLTIAASAGSLLAVRLVRGIGNHLESFTVVDGRAGSSDASALCYFGLKTSTHINLDLCVPRNWLDPENSPPAHATICPLPASTSAFDQSVYVATQEYFAQPISGQLNDVLFRATLKQFEASWEGPITGRLNAALYRDPRETPGGSWPELRGESWVENKLGTDLDNCYVFVATRGFWEGRPRRFNEIYAYPIGQFPDGQRVSISEVLARLGPQDEKAKSRNRVGAPQDILMDRPAQPEGSKKPRPRLLTNEGARWLDRLGRNRPTPYQPQYGQGTEKTETFKPETFASAMLLLCTYDDLDLSDEQFEGVETSQGQRLDRSLAITRDTALFIGFGEDPGPARLCWRRSGRTSGWKAVVPDRSRTMYRFTIPISSSPGR